MKYEPFQPVPSYEPGKPDILTGSTFPIPEIIHEEKAKEHVLKPFLTPEDLDLGNRVNLVDTIGVHTTASGPNSTSKGNQNYMLSKWRIGGYNVMVERNGDVVVYYPASQLTNGILGHNRHTWHVSWVGGVDKKLNIENNITEPQMESLRRVVNEAYISFSEQCPHKIYVRPHNYYEKSRACPIIDVEAEIIPYVDYYDGSNKNISRKHESVARGVKKLYSVNRN